METDPNGLNNGVRSSRGWGARKNVPGSFKAVDIEGTSTIASEQQAAAQQKTGASERSTAIEQLSLSSSRSAEPSSSNGATIPPPQTFEVVSGGVRSSRGLSTSSSKDVDDSLSNSTPVSPPSSTNAPEPLSPALSYRDRRFRELLDATVVNLEELKTLSWNGVPPEERATVWQLLLAYLPSDSQRRDSALQRKRQEYASLIPMFFDVPSSSRSHSEQAMLRQILVDVPRTAPDVPLFHQAKIHRCLERLLYIMSIRHPAIGYVQGMNDIAIPLFVVFLAHETTSTALQAERMDAGKLSDDTLTNVEADTYWCLTKLLENIQDHYTSGNPGVQRQMFRLEELIQRVDTGLAQHLEENGVSFSFFAFRWMNCLLTREMPLQAVIRLWDTLLSEYETGCGFEDFHVFVCAAFLEHFSKQMVGLPMDELMLFVQHFPTMEWGLKEVETLVSEAFVLSTLYRDSPSHLAPQHHKA